MSCNYMGIDNHELVWQTEIGRESRGWGSKLGHSIKIVKGEVILTLQHDTEEVESLVIIVYLLWKSFQVPYAKSFFAWSRFASDFILR